MKCLISTRWHSGNSEGSLSLLKPYCSMCLICVTVYILTHEQPSYLMCCAISHNWCTFFFKTLPEDASLDICRSHCNRLVVSKKVDGFRLMWNGPIWGIHNAAREPGNISGSWYSEIEFAFDFIMT